MNSRLDPSLCPLCGQDNMCGAVAGKVTCWCFTHPLPDVVRERIPPEARDEACVCRWCASGQVHPTLVQEQIERLARGR